MNATRPINWIKLGGRGLLAISFGLLVVLGSVMLLVRLSGGELLGVQTGSMLPVLRPGDAVVIRPATADSLRPGVIISYHSPANQRLIITHRLVRIDPRSGWLITRGDATPINDPAFPPRLVVGQVWAVAPRLGILLDAIRRRRGLVLLVYAPGAAIITVETRRLFRGLARSSYHLFGAR